jgi:hypothetical protein
MAAVGRSNRAPEQFDDVHGVNHSLLINGPVDRALSTISELFSNKLKQTEIRAEVIYIKSDCSNKLKNLISDVVQNVAKIKDNSTEYDAKYFELNEENQKIISKLQETILSDNFILRFKQMGNFIRFLNEEQFEVYQTLRDSIDMISNIDESFKLFENSSVEGLEVLLEKLETFLNAEI